MAANGRVGATAAVYSAAILGEPLLFAWNSETLSSFGSSSFAVLVRCCQSCLSWHSI